MKNSIITTPTFGIVLFTLIAGVAAWITVINPQLDQLKETAKKRDENVVALQAAQQKQELLGSAKRQYETIKQDLARTTIAIPQGSNTGEFVAALEQVANNTGVTIGAISTSVHAKVATNTKGGKTTVAKTLEEELARKYNSTSFDLRLAGSYETIRLFIERLRTLDRFNVLSTLTLSSAPDTGIITANLSMSIYHKEAAKAL